MINLALWAGVGLLTTQQMLPHQSGRRPGHHTGLGWGWGHPNWRVWSMRVFIPQLGTKQQWEQGSRMLVMGWPKLLTQTSIITEVWMRHLLEINGYKERINIPLENQNDSGSIVCSKLSKLVGTVGPTLKETSSYKMAQSVCVWNNMQLYRSIITFLKMYFYWFQKEWGDI